ncbi:MAG TPA: phage holin family protein [Candidatus Limnocylindrales bacterium]|nr:phage holin family protein [Candidatus Limnocylindrales bacterium]
MKTILRKIAVYTFALFALPSVVPGVKIAGGLETIFIGGALLALMFLVLKPIINIISFPIRLVTLGLFSVISNAFILYLMTMFVEGITINPFEYPEVSFLGFSTPGVSFNIYLAYVISAVVISLIVSILSWLME